jgi:putative endonuclease
LTKIHPGQRSPRRSTNSDAGSLRRIVGARAEDAAAAHLEQLGLAIIGRNVRVGRAEIDLVARDGPVIVIVEVRTRGASSYQRALDSIDARKRARLRAAGAHLWRARFARDPSLERMRFDAAAVTFSPDGEALVEHVRAAF